MESFVSIDQANNQYVYNSQTPVTLDYVNIVFSTTIQLQIFHVKLLKS